MALSRKFLKELLAEHENRDEVIDQIVDAHYETVAGLKTELQQLIEANGGRSYEDVHAEVERIETEIEQIRKEDVDEAGVSWKQRYEDVKAKHEALRKEMAAKDEYAAKRTAYREVLTSCGVPYRICELAAEANVHTINGIEVFNGKIKDVEALKTSIRNEFGEFISKKG